MLSIPTSPKPRNTPHRRFKPIGEIIRTAKGKPIGRLLRRLRERQTEAFDYTGPIGKFDSEKAAIAAIRAKHELRSWARAYLWWAGEYSLHEAVDILWHDAERDGLVDELGEDGVQQILADAFAPFREAEL